MKSLKSAARRGLIVAVASASALGLASCSAGHITQTSDKVAAVNGASVDNNDQTVSIRDAAITVDPDTREAALKFVLVNDGYADGTVELESIDVDGQKVDIDAVKPISRGQTVVADSADGIEQTPQTDDKDVQYVTTSLKDDDFGFAGSRDVTFHLSSGDMTVNAPIAAPDEVAGSVDRDVESPEGYTTETAGPQHDADK